MKKCNCDTYAGDVCEICLPQPSYDIEVGEERLIQNETVEDWERFVGEAIGEASMCWMETPRSVFDRENAIRIKM